ncbi:ribosomal protein s6 kinase delta- hypothetical protein [Limosa lapponica baueri]|uniref:Uncharacterized protein n=1 Tax=Limosa lapponica baueri TaxID=1758121 RepID=A0A2I0US97_LIMLA|nr:ribosomal protein s6 kinase delta- hypothetical protein [Limosa lapponica baueri]
MPFVKKSTLNCEYNDFCNKKITGGMKSLKVKACVWLLQFNPAERLGAGVAGVEDIKSHPFFALIEWADLLR